MRDLSPASTGSRLRGLAAILAVAAALGLWMDLSPLHRHHDGDSIVPVLMSLDRWAPFYWEQNRFGMLVPLLALPVRGPYHNLLVQVAIRLTMVAACFFLLARAVLPRPYWPAAGAGTLGLYIAGKGLYAHCFFQMQPYGQAMCLALLAIACFNRRDRPLVAALGALCLTLAFWISFTILFWLVALLWLRKVLGLEPDSPGWRLWPRPRDLLSREILPFLAAGLLFMASVLATRFSSWGGTDLAPARPATWPHAWASLAHSSAKFLGPALLAPAVVTLAAAALAAVFRRSRRAALASSVGLCLFGTAVAEELAMGTSSWVHLNEFTIRFVSCGLLTAAMSLPAMAAVLLLEGRESWHRAVNVAAILALVPLAWLRFGPPSPAAARAALDAHLGTRGRKVVEARCTHVIGSYWRVWNAVLGADQVLWERGEKRRVWGISARSRPTRDLWWPRSWRDARVGVVANDSAAPQAMSAFRLPPLYLLEAGDVVRVYSGAPPPGSAVPGASMVSFPPPVPGSPRSSLPQSQEPRP